MASMLDENFLVLAVKTRFQQKLREHLEEASKEIIDDVVQELQADLELSTNRWVDSYHMENYVKVIVEDRRK